MRACSQDGTHHFSGNGNCGVNQHRIHPAEQFERINRKGAGLGPPSSSNGSHRPKSTKVGVVNEEKEKEDRG